MFEELVGAVIDAEIQVSGAHADNAAAAIMGGIVMVENLDPLVVHPLPVPSETWLALVTPDVVVHTRTARDVLPGHVSRGTAVGQAARLAAMVDACHRDHLERFARNAVDGIAHAARIDLIPNGAGVLCAAEHAGALGTFISGSGPTLAAIARGPLHAQRIVDSMGEELTAVTKGGSAIFRP